MKLNHFLAAAFTASALFITSCSSDDDHEPIPTGAFANGVVVLNEGNFGSGNASASFINAQGIAQNNIFEAVNNELLGDTAQSIYSHNDKIFMVINGSNSIVVVDRYTFEKEAVISTGLNNPRYLITKGGKAYVTNWGDPTNPNDDFVAVYNLSNYSLETTISVSEGPEKMVEANGKIYVAQMGGWNFGNTISVINTSNHTVSAVIDVMDVPHSMVEEDGKLFVLSSGKAAWTGDETDGALQTIDLNTETVTNTLSFSGQHPTHLEESNGKLYYTMGDKVYTKAINSNSTATQLFSMSDQGAFGAYGFAVENGKIYIGDAGDYTSNGEVLIYGIDGVFISSQAVGALPSGFAFND